MAFSCFLSSQLGVCTLRIDRPGLPSNASCNKITSQRRYMSALQTKNPQLLARQVGSGFLGGWKTIEKLNLGRNIPCRKSSAVYASWLPSPQIASSAFTLGTAAVLPYYTFMVVAPRADLTKKLVASSLPYMVLGVLYTYLLYLSWTPDTIRLMFASKYWLPELPGIAKMFSSEMTLASAWIHLLAVDLFAARQVYYDGLQDDIETRHSVSLCLLFCPIGILSHFITKALTTTKGEAEHRIN